MQSNYIYIIFFISNRENVKKNNSSEKRVFIQKK